MTITQSEFLKSFEEALLKYSENASLKIKPVVFTKNSEFKKTLSQHESIDIPECLLEIVVFISVSPGKDPKNGIWVIIKDLKPIVFHFPLNSGNNIVLNIYSTYPIGPTASIALTKSLLPIFGRAKLYKEQIMPLPVTSKRNPAIMPTFYDAIHLVDKRIRKTYCINTSDLS